MVALPLIVACSVFVDSPLNLTTTLFLVPFINFSTEPTSLSFCCSRAPFSFLTPEIVEATCQCLLAQAEESERNQVAEEAAEGLIIEEFGRCLVQIIDMANKTKISNGS